MNKTHFHDNDYSLINLLYLNVKCIFDDAFIGQINSTVIKWNFEMYNEINIIFSIE